MSTILIVEDNEMNRDMLSRRLKRRGYEVAIATDGRAGVAAARELVPDLVLMDMSLPEIDGWEATRQLKADPATAAAYNAHVAAESEEFEEHVFLARKGDVLFWHGMLIHGGQAIRRPGTTRRSYVVHFIPDGADVADRVTGPTNW